MPVGKRVVEPTVAVFSRPATTTASEDTGSSVWSTRSSTTSPSKYSLRRTTEPRVVAGILHKRATSIRDVSLTDDSARLTVIDVGDYRGKYSPRRPSTASSADDFNSVPEKDTTGVPPSVISQKSVAFKDEMFCSSANSLLRLKDSCDAQRLNRKVVELRPDGSVEGRTRASDSVLHTFAGGLVSNVNKSTKVVKETISSPSLSRDDLMNNASSSLPWPQRKMNEVLNTGLTSKLKKFRCSNPGPDCEWRVRETSSDGSCHRLNKIRDEKKLEKLKARIMRQQEEREEHERLAHIEWNEQRLQAKRTASTLSVQSTDGTQSARKVAHIASAPTYRGFCDGGEVKPRVQKVVHTQISKQKTVNSKNDSGLRTKSWSSKPRAQIPLKRKKSSVILKPTSEVEKSDVITPSSWRTSHKKLRHLLGPPQHVALRKAKEKAIDSLLGNEENANKENEELDVDAALAALISEESESGNEKHVSENGDKTAEPEHENASDKSVSSGRVNLVDVSGSQMEPAIATALLDVQDLADHLNADWLSAKERNGDEPSVQKSSALSKKRKAHKQPVAGVAPCPKVRHYDATQVRSYMMQKKAEKKKELHEEKMRKKLAEEDKKKKLEELARKQKRAALASIRKSTTSPAKQTTSERLEEEGEHENTFTVNCANEAMESQIGLQLLTSTGLSLQHLNVDVQTSAADLNDVAETTAVTTAMPATDIPHNEQLVPSSDPEHVLVTVGPSPRESASMGSTLVEKLSVIHSQNVSADTEKMQSLLASASSLQQRVQQQMQLYTKRPKQNELSEDKSDEKHAGRMPRHQRASDEEQDCRRKARKHRKSPNVSAPVKSRQEIVELLRAKLSAECEESQSTSEKFVPSEKPFLDGFPSPKPTLPVRTITADPLSVINLYTQDYDKHHIRCQPDGRRPLSRKDKATSAHLRCHKDYKSSKHIKSKDLTETRTVNKDTRRPPLPNRETGITAVKKDLSSETINADYTFTASSESRSVNHTDDIYSMPVPDEMKSESVHNFSAITLHDSATTLHDRPVIDQIKLDSVHTVSTPYVRSTLDEVKSERVNTVSANSLHNTSIQESVHTVHATSSVSASEVISESVNSSQSESIPGEANLKCVHPVSETGSHVLSIHDLVKSEQTVSAQNLSDPDEVISESVHTVSRNSSHNINLDDMNTIGTVSLPSVPVPKPRERSSKFMTGTNKTTKSETGVHINGSDSQNLHESSKNSRQKFTEISLCSLQDFDKTPSERLPESTRTASHSIRESLKAASHSIQESARTASESVHESLKTTSHSVPEAHKTASHSMQKSARTASHGIQESHKTASHSIQEPHKTTSHSGSMSGKSKSCSLAKRDESKVRDVSRSDIIVPNSVSDENHSHSDDSTLQSVSNIEEVLPESSKYNGSAASSEKIFLGSNRASESSDKLAEEKMANVKIEESDRKTPENVHPEVIPEAELLNQVVQDRARSPSDVAAVLNAAVASSSHLRIKETHLNSPVDTTAQSISSFQPSLPIDHPAKTHSLEWKPHSSTDSKQRSYKLHIQHSASTKSRSLDDQKQFRSPVQISTTEPKKDSSLQGRPTSQVSHRASAEIRSNLQEMKVGRDVSCATSLQFVKSGANDLVLNDDVYSRLTLDMVHMYIEDEDRHSQQQVEMFKLREGALQEKTKSELALLQLQKEKVREKGEEAVVPIRNQQRALLKQLEVERTKMKRLLEARIAASKERRLLLLKQQEELLMLEKRTRQIKLKLKRSKDEGAATVNKKKKDEQTVEVELTEVTDQSAAVLHTEDEVSIALDEESAPTSASEVLPASFSEKQNMAEPSVSKAESVKSELPSQTETEDLSYSESHQLLSAESGTTSTSISETCPKVNNRTEELSKRYLKKREQKLSQRRHEAEKLLAWTRRLDEEENRVKQLEKAVLRRHADMNKASENTSGAKTELSVALSSSRSTIHQVSMPRSTAVTSDQGQGSPDKPAEESASVPEVESLAAASDASSSWQPAANVPLSNDSSRPLPGLASQSNVKSPALGPNESVNDLSQSKVVGISPLSTLSRSTPRAGKMLSRNVIRSTMARNRDSDSGSDDSFSHPVSESMSDQSDVEGRIRALTEQLRTRKMQASHLKQEQKRLRREKLKAKEKSLCKQIEAYDVFISQAQSELNQQLEASLGKSVKPQIKKPKVANLKSLKEQQNKAGDKADDSSQAEQSTPRLSCSEKELPKTPHLSRSESESSKSSFDHEDGSRTTLSVPIMSPREQSSSTFSEGVSKEADQSVPSFLDETLRDQSAAKSEVPEVLSSLSGEADGTHLHTDQKLLTSHASQIPTSDVVDNRITADDLLAKTDDLTNSFAANSLAKTTVNVSVSPATATVEVDKVSQDQNDVSVIATKSPTSISSSIKSPSSLDNTTAPIDTLTALSSADSSQMSTPRQTATPSDEKKSSAFLTPTESYEISDHVLNATNKSEERAASPTELFVVKENNETVPFQATPISSLAFISEKVSTVSEDIEEPTYTDDFSDTSTLTSATKRSIFSQGTDKGQVVKPALEIHASISERISEHSRSRSGSKVQEMSLQDSCLSEIGEIGNEVSERKTEELSIATKSVDLELDEAKEVETGSLEQKSLSHLTGQYSAETEMPPSGKTITSTATSSDDKFIEAPSFSTTLQKNLGVPSEEFVDSLTNHLLKALLMSTFETMYKINNASLKQSELLAEDTDKCYKDKSFDGESKTVSITTEHEEKVASIEELSTEENAILTKEVTEIEDVAVVKEEVTAEGKQSPFRLIKEDDEMSPVNQGTEEAAGAQVPPFKQVTEEAAGAQVPPFKQVTEEVKGAQVPPFKQITKEAEGAQVPPFKQVMEEAEGAQVPPFKQVTEEAEGAQVPSFKQGTEEVKGAQVPPFKQITKEAEGAQVPPFKQVLEEAEGAQVPSFKQMLEEAEATSMAPFKLTSAAEVATAEETVMEKDKVVLSEEVPSGAKVSVDNKITSVREVVKKDKMTPVEVTMEVKVAPSSDMKDIHTMTDSLTSCVIEMLLSEAVQMFVSLSRESKIVEEQSVPDNKHLDMAALSIQQYLQKDNANEALVANYAKDVQVLDPPEGLGETMKATVGTDGTGIVMWHDVGKAAFPEFALAGESDEDSRSFSHSDAFELGTTANDDEVMAWTSRVQEGSPKSPSSPIPRPMSPVFGEYSVVNQNELSERLDTLQSGPAFFTDELTLEGDLYDDDIELTSSLIPPIVHSKPPPPYTPPSGLPPPPPNYQTARLDLQRCYQPFSVVPKFESDVTPLIHTALETLHEVYVDCGSDELDFAEVPTGYITSEECQGFDLVNTSQRAYKNFLFVLSKEVVQDVYIIKEQPEQPFFKTSSLAKPQHPQSFPELLSKTKSELDELLQLTPARELTNMKLGSRKRDYVDSILVQELKSEENQWLDYSKDEYAVKLQLTDTIFRMLIDETVKLFIDIAERYANE